MDPEIQRNEPDIFQAGMEFEDLMEVNAGKTGTSAVGEEAGQKRGGKAKRSGASGMLQPLLPYGLSQGAEVGQTDDGNPADDEGAASIDGQRVFGFVVDRPVLTVREDDHLDPGGKKRRRVGKMGPSATQVPDGQAGETSENTGLKDTSKKGKRPEKKNWRLLWGADPKKADWITSALDRGRSVLLRQVGENGEGGFETISQELAETVFDYTRNPGWVLRNVSSGAGRTVENRTCGGRWKMPLSPSARPVFIGNCIESSHADGMCPEPELIFPRGKAVKIYELRDKTPEDEKDYTAQRPCGRCGGHTRRETSVRERQTKAYDYYLVERRCLRCDRISGPLEPDGLTSPVNRIFFVKVRR